MTGMVGRAGLRNLVEAVGGGSHVFVKAVEARVECGTLRVPKFEAAGTSALSMLGTAIRRL